METFRGPLLTFSLLRSIYCHWRLLSYIFIYKKKPTVHGLWLMAAVLCLAAIAMALGIFAAIMGLWLPHMS